MSVRNSASFTMHPLSELLGARGLEDGGKVQKFVDSEVLRLSDPYIPKDTGNLIGSGILGTTIGSGEVVYNAPYSAAQYYGTADTRSYDAQRGGHWFERMKADHKDAILNGAKEIAKGGQQ